MSYHQVKAIKMENNQILIFGKCSNVGGEFEWWHNDYLTNILQKKGIDATELAVLVAYECGNFKSSQSIDNKFTRALEILQNLADYKFFDWREVNYNDINCKISIARKSKAFTELLKQSLSLCRRAMYESFNILEKQKKEEAANKKEVLLLGFKEFLTKLPVITNFKSYRYKRKSGRGINKEFVFFILLDGKTVFFYKNLPLFETFDINAIYSNADKLSILRLSETTKLFGKEVIKHRDLLVSTELLSC